MRFLPLAALLFFIPLSAGAQDACTADFGTHIGSPACPYQWVGATTVAYDGSGNGLGFVGMTSQCRADFGAGARLCTSQEILESDTLNFNAIPEDGCWVRSVYQPVTGDDNTLASALLALDASGINSAGLSGRGGMACVGWSTTSGGERGLILAGTADPSVSPGSFYTGVCAASRSVACCAPTPVPTPVPAPTSSLPIGTLGLVALVSLKG